MPMLKHNNISICYETFGDVNNPCLILIAGITGQLINWPVEFTQGLADKGFYVIIFDNRDVGLSTYYDHLATPSLSEALAIKQQGRTLQPPYTLNDMADDIVTLMDGLNIDKAHIAGVSMGGQIAQLFAIEYPERILSLTCIATSTGDPGLPPPKSEVLEFFFGSGMRATDLKSHMNNYMQLYKLYNHPEDMDESAAQQLYEATYARAYHPAGNNRQLLAMMFAEPRGNKLKQLNVPSLIIHGDYDPVVSVEHGEQLAQCLSNSRLTIIKNMGHGLPKKVYNTIIDLMAVI